MISIKKSFIIARKKIFIVAGNLFLIVAGKIKKHKCPGLVQLWDYFL